MTWGRRAGRGTLFVVAMLFATSGALRLGSGVGVALARAEEGATDDPAVPEAAVCESPAALSEALTLRSDRVAAQEAALQDRLAALALAEAAITRRMDELAAMEAELKSTIALADGAAEADIEKLTAVYQAMKPKDAASLFEAMSPEFAAGFLGRMPPESAAAILSGMSAEAAYGVSVIVAGRNVGAPTD
jgi:flagellar motility protein MotE (MotC chaperone)